ncbi:MAG: MBOAT family O-acyltransferase [Myxococcota bacterium]|nr:MBOAT family O-acyltransferase [Myxococcota bacterium]
MSTWVDFSIGRRLEQTEDEARRSRLVAISVCFNLGTLAVFKYFNFFIDSAVQALNAVGFAASTSSLEIILPVGISFYTFQTMSYTIDIYRREMAATRDPLDFAIYVAFFPQLVAGPIERANRLLPQIESIQTQSRYDSSGWGLIAIGCFKKVVIADNLAHIVDAVYSNPSGVYGPALWLATYAFAIQIYCDFSGYSDIAVGLARLLGIQLIQNFEAPYAAATPSEFWRRWHISLSTWLRDYLYIPLGGNRGTQWNTYRNLMLTMLLGGLWHGAAWNFILWGAWHGLLLALFRMYQKRRPVNASIKGHTNAVSLLLKRLVFFHLVCLGWALFRAQNLTDCGVLISGLLTVWDWQWLPWTRAVAASGLTGSLILGAVACALMLAAQWVYPYGSNRLVARIWRLPRPLIFVFVTGCLYCAVLAAPEQAPPFIYFQF